MKTASMLSAIMTVAAVALMSGATVVRAQDALSIANNDSIYIDAGTFKVLAGKAKGDMSSRIKQLGARELAPGAIVFRVSDKLYIVDANAEPQMVLAYDPSRPFAYDPGDPRRYAYDRSGGFIPDPSRPFARDSGDPARFAYDPSRPYAYDPADPRRYAIDPSRPYAYDPADPRRYAIDPSRPYAYDPGDPRRYAYDPNDPHSPLIYNPNAERQARYIRDPDYALYRLKKIFDETWTASGVK